MKKAVFLLVILSAAFKLSVAETHFNASKPFVKNDTLLAVADSPNLDTLSLATRRADSLRRIELVHVESLKQQFKLMPADSLKQQLKVNSYELLKGPIYSELALRYLNYDTISNKEKRLKYQENALNYTMMALHQYSKYNDTTGLRMNYDNLAKVYFAQKKYIQAKWFILQSNTLSRARNDVPNIITSLLTLSAIKTDIKDYDLAKGDLDEAKQLSVTNNLPKLEMDVLKNYAALYSRLKNYPKAALALKQRDSIEAGIRKSERDSLMAKIAQDSVQKRKADSLQIKKKVYTATYRKPYKSSSVKKIALL